MPYSGRYDTMPTVTVAQRVATQVTEVRPARMLLAALATLVYGVAWTAAFVVLFVFTSLAWAFESARLGWTDASVTVRKRR